MSALTLTDDLFPVTISNPKLGASNKSLVTSELTTNNWALALVQKVKSINATSNRLNCFIYVLVRRNVILAISSYSRCKYTNFPRNHQIFNKKIVIAMRVHSNNYKMYNEGVIILSFVTLIVLDAERQRQVLAWHVCIDVVAQHHWRRHLVWIRC